MKVNRFYDGDLAFDSIYEGYLISSISKTIDEILSKEENVGELVHEKDGESE